MDLKLPPALFVCLLLTVLVQLLHKVDALPQRTLVVDDFYSGGDADRFDRDYYISVPISDYRLSRLRRGYYYVDDGYITSVPSYGYAGAAANRRQDADGDDSARRSTYQPLVKYKQTKAKRKKLFVPNFFG